MAERPSLSSEQLAALAAERTVDQDRPQLSVLLARFRHGLEAAMDYLRVVPSDSLLGLIFHAAEHSARHAGQIVTLTRVVH